MSELTPLDKLAEKVKTKPCPACITLGLLPHRCPICNGVETLNTDDPLFNALWRSKPVPYSRGRRHEGHIRRSRAESALLLPEALRKLGYEYRVAGTQIAFVYLNHLNNTEEYIGEGVDWLDALAAAILAKLNRTEGRRLE